MVTGFFVEFTRIFGILQLPKYCTKEQEIKPKYQIKFAQNLLDGKRKEDSNRSPLFISVRPAWAITWW